MPTPEQYSHAHYEARCLLDETSMSPREIDTDRQAWIDRTVKARAEVVRLREALDRIAFCGAGEDYRVLREIARKALETPANSQPQT